MPARFEKAASRADQVASFDQYGRPPIERLHRFLHANPTAAPLIVPALSLVEFGSIADNFLTAFNFSLIVQQVTVIGVLGIAQTLVILTAGVDLSVAAIMVPSSVVMGRLGVTMGLPIGFALLLGLAVGMAAGAINGALITRLRLPPFIATLGARSIFLALTQWYSEAQTVRSQDIDAAAPLLKIWGERAPLMGAQFTTGSFLMIAMFSVGWYLLNKAPRGRAVHAIGDDKDAAELAGIRTDKVLHSVYIGAGAVCAIAGWIAIGRLGSVSPQSFYNGNLDAITAVVIGGCSLFGGRGSIMRALVGALIVGVFRSGLKLAEVNVLWQQFTVRLLIIIAEAVDQWIRKVSA
jgi:fructose transport system permease protein